MPTEMNDRISDNIKKKVIRLRGSVLNYGWGQFGSGGAVARLYAANSGGPIDSSKPYAEFWMGTHHSGPSFLLLRDPNQKASDGIVGLTLNDWILNNPSVLGHPVLHKWGSHLPFLFKVLSVAKPLSIQAHPDKVLARDLHKLHPNLYKDDNHKPEIALALTEFEALCGFLDIKELKEVVIKFPEIEDLVTPICRDQLLNVGEEEKEENIKAAVKSLFTQIMGGSKELVSAVQSKLKTRLIMQNELTTKEQLVLSLEDKYPNDVGVIAALLMNYMKLNPGEALCLGANELHAYISGDCIECMATSDNAVRAGLTPKERDVNTLCSMLTYNLGCPQKLEGVPVNKYTTGYRPPYEEFEVDRCILPVEELVSFPAIVGPSIFVVMDGDGVMQTSESAEESVIAGDVLFAPANVEVNIRSGSMLEIYRAGVNSD